MRNFPDLPRPNSSSSRPSKGNTCCTRTERCCCTIATWLPISIVYGATLWAIYVNAYLISISFIEGLLGWCLAILALTLYGLCIWSYSVAVFTDPGSPIDADNGYSYLPQWTPSTDPNLQTNLTVKNDGRARYCQKCNYNKPDRTHHCSICRRCILKMDHHCPWLGNCIGFGNYKSFVLFLCYLSLFCFECCVTCSICLWYWISHVSPNADILPVQWILLAVISGVVSLCVGGFSIWHLIRVCNNTTTIEAMEKTRYIHNIPRPSSPRRRSSNDTPNIFDLGRKENWNQVMGERRIYWFLPIQNSIGNGLAFPVSQDVRGILQGMRGSNLGEGIGFDGSAVEDEEDERVWRRDGGGRWMVHD